MTNQPLVKSGQSYKVAITISGAVSLGCFEAGALYEFLETARRYNDNKAPDELPIEIDVFTGASAGGMTAAIAVRNLLYSGTGLQHPTDNPFYQAWVAQIDINGLARLGFNDNPDLSIFSSDLIMQIAAKFLTKPLPDVANKHVAASNDIHVGLALSNLSGVDYGVEIFGGDVSTQKSVTDQNKASSQSSSPGVPTKPEFIYTKYADEIRRVFTAGNFDPIKWTDFSNYVRSCGAFPFAFRPVPIDVPNSHYPGAKNRVGDAQTNMYTDGGVFQNEPLGLAKSIVDGIDKHIYNENRYYLYIAPSLRGSTRDSAPLELGDMNAFTMARVCVKAIFNQSRFQDWIDTEQINKQLKAFDEQVGKLQDAIKNSALDVQQLNDVSDQMLKLQFNNNSQLIQKQLIRLSNQYSEELARFTVPAHSTAWLKAVLVLETSAGLGDKDEMRIFGVTAEESELASARVFAFTGFFDMKLREHDYNIGRKKCREVLQSIHPLAPFIDTSGLVIDPQWTNYDLFSIHKNTPQMIVKLEKTISRIVSYLTHGFGDVLCAVGREAEPAWIAALHKLTSTVPTQVSFSLAIIATSFLQWALVVHK